MIPHTQHAAYPPASAPYTALCDWGPVHMALCIWPCAYGLSQSLATNKPRYPVRPWELSLSYQFSRCTGKQGLPVLGVYNCAFCPQNWRWWRGAARGLRVSGLLVRAAHTCICCLCRWLRSYGSAHCPASCLHVCALFTHMGFVCMYTPCMHVCALQHMWMRSCGSAQCCPASCLHVCALSTCTLPNYIHT